MFKFIQTSIFASVLLPTSGMALQSPLHEFWGNLYTEPGVLTRFVPEYFGTLSLETNWNLDVDGALSPLEQIEPSLLGAELSYRLEDLSSLLALGVQQERYSFWQILENRSEIYWTLFFNSSVQLSFGLGFKATQYSVNSFLESFNWPLDAAEFNILYRFAWKFWKSDPLDFNFIFGNYDRMRLYTPSNAHFVLVPEYRFDPNWTFLGYVASAVKGFSGGIFTFSQFTFSLGARYAM